MRLFALYLLLFHILTSTQCIAQKAVLTPAAQLAKPDYDTTAWTEIIRLDSTIAIDIRYATTNNFMKAQVYDCPRAFLRPNAALAILKAHRTLKKQGYGIKIFDAYRPKPYQQRLWDKKPDEHFVTNPKKGSKHSRGVAVDVTIVDKEGKELDMGTTYDFFGPEAYTNYEKLTAVAKANRKLLRETLQDVGFNTIKTEWWHLVFNHDAEFSEWVWKCK
jgi:zinc D-Ala-D-Ala dipeptidase